MSVILITKLLAAYFFRVQPAKRSGKKEARRPLSKTIRENIFRIVVKIYVFTVQPPPSRSYKEVVLRSRSTRFYERLEGNRLSKKITFPSLYDTINIFISRHSREFKITRLLRRMLNRVMHLKRYVLLRCIYLWRKTAREMVLIESCYATAVPSESFWL